MNMNAEENREKPRRLCITVGYYGEHFSGWQIQKEGRTVQGVLEEAVSAIVRHPVRIIGSGRTDAGVHAKRQSAHFDTANWSIPAAQFIPAVNAQLPQDVRVLNCREVSESFHARYSAQTREYRYYVLPRDDAHIPPGLHMSSRCFCLNCRPSLQLMNAYARSIVGTHDFTAFSAAGDGSRTRIRRIDSAVWYPEQAYYVFRIQGNAFLWKMVRSLAGTMLFLERNSSETETMRKILESRDRRRAGTTAPARGLYLWQVGYGADV